MHVYPAVRPILHIRIVKDGGMQFASVLVENHRVWCKSHLKYINANTDSKARMNCGFVVCMMIGVRGLNCNIICLMSVYRHAYYFIFF